MKISATSQAALKAYNLVMLGQRTVPSETLADIIQTAIDSETAELKRQRLQDTADLNREIYELAQQLAEARKNAKQLDWIIKNQAKIEKSGGQWAVVYAVIGGVKHTFGKTAHSAIDAAQRSEGPSCAKEEA